VDLNQQPAIVAQNVQRRLLRLQLLGNDRQLILTHRTRLNARRIQTLPRPATLITEMFQGESQLKEHRHLMDGRAVIPTLGTCHNSFRASSEINENQFLSKLNSQFQTKRIHQS
jgi:hypothetical protein